MLNGIFSVEFVNSILRATTPILFATMASSVAAKAGICNMALEGDRKSTRLNSSHA